MHHGRGRTTTVTRAPGLLPRQRLSDRGSRTHSPPPWPFQNEPERDDQEPSERDHESPDNAWSKALLQRWLLRRGWHCCGGEGWCADTGWQHRGRMGWCRGSGGRLSRLGSGDAGDVRNPPVSVRAAPGPGRRVGCARPPFGQGAASDLLYESAYLLGLVDDQILAVPVVCKVRAAELALVADTFSAHALVPEVLVASGAGGLTTVPEDFPSLGRVTPVAVVPLDDFCTLPGAMIDHDDRGRGRGAGRARHR
jgi:hypothetical protein